jgi:hypothetical protein
LLASGVMAFRRTGATPTAAYHALIELFCKTGGYSNDLLHRAIAITHPPYPLPPARGILGDLAGSAIEPVLESLRRDGFYAFPKPLPEGLVDDMVRFAYRTPAKLLGRTESAIYDPRNPVATRYDFRECDVMQNEAARQIVGDPSVLALAQRYLGCQPILDIVTLWWSTVSRNNSAEEAAQLYHFDMDRIKWLKLFVYLTDVTPRSGPTCFIRGSHRWGSQPRELLGFGYSRIPEELIRQHYPTDRIVELTAKRGSIVAVDTRGFHKGKPLEEKDRLVFQIEYCDSLFGAAYEKTRVALPPASPLRGLSEKYPRIFSKFEWTSEDPATAFAINPSPASSFPTRRRL